MKVISNVTGEVVCEIVTNHSMSLDEALNLVGEAWSSDGDGDAVMIDGVYHYYDDLEIEA
jgi:hypothetical protein